MCVDVPCKFQTCKWKIVDFVEETNLVQIGFFCNLKLFSVKECSGDGYQITTPPMTGKKSQNGT